MVAMGDLAGPVNQRELDQNLQLADALTKAVDQGIKDDARRLRRSAEIDQGARKTWAQFLERATTQDDLKYALGLKTHYAPEDLSTLGKRAAFNLSLFNLQQSLADAKHSSTSDAALEVLLTKVQASADALPDPLRGQSDVSAFVSALRAWKATSPTQIDFAKLGPMSPLAGAGKAIAWRFRYDDQAGIVTYSAAVPADITSDRSIEVAFRKIDTDVNVLPFFLCTTETSLGLFSDVVSAGW